MFHKKLRLGQRLIVTGLVLAGLLLAVSMTFALNQYLKSWEDHYPGSATAAAGCDLCHGTSTNNLNSYGKDLCLAFEGEVPADINAALAAIDFLDSDGNGDSNLAEIMAGAQPGWTAVLPNQIYSADVAGGCPPAGAPISPPASLPLPLDPPVNGEPVAIPGGPYTGNAGVPVVFDGSASYDSDGGSIVTYAWDFGDGGAAEGAVLAHPYAVAGTYTVTLTVTDDEGQTNSAMTTAVISGDDVLDLDIAAFTVPRTARTGKAIAIELSVTNDGPVLGQALATVRGTRDGDMVYIWRLNVYDYPDKKATTFRFPSYTPTSKGTIVWTVEIDDVDPDVDFATGQTVVK